MDDPRTPEVRGVAATTIAGSFALAAFAVAIVAGLASGNATASVLVRAVVAMLLCYPAGFAVGKVAERVLREHLDAHRESNPAQGGSDMPGSVVDGEILDRAAARDEAAEEEEVIVV